MNVIGNIGQFFINYQTEIEAVVFVLLVLLTLYLLIRNLGRDRKNTKKIAELSAKLDAIENQVSPNQVSPKEVPEEKEAATDTPPIEVTEVKESPLNIEIDSKPLGPKLSSRESGTDRQGNVYTEEMLRDQIG